MKIKLHSPTTIVVASVALFCCGVLPPHGLAAATGDHHFDKKVEDHSSNNQLVQSDGIGVAGRAIDHYQMKKLPSTIALRASKKDSVPTAVAVVDLANENPKSAIAPGGDHADASKPHENIRSVSTPRFDLEVSRTVALRTLKKNSVPAAVAIVDIASENSKSAIAPEGGDHTDASNKPHENIRSVSTPRFDLEVSRALDDPPFESACNKTDKEIELEQQVETLEAQLEQERNLVDDADLLYNQSLNAFYVAYNESNAVFDTLLAKGEVLEKSGNDTVDDLDEFLVAEETLRVPEAEVNSTMGDFNASFTVFVAKNDTYNQALENGDPDEIEAAEAALNEATLALNNTVQSLVTALTGWNSTSHLVDEKVQQASASMDLYFNAFDAWNATIEMYGAKLEEENATRTTYLDQYADLEAAENIANQTRQLLYDAQDALAQARDDAFQACLEANFTSNTDRRGLRAGLGDGGRRLNNVDCSGLEKDVKDLEDDVEEAEEALESAERELKKIKDNIVDMTQTVGRLRRKYKDAKDEYEKAMTKAKEIQKEINEILEKITDKDLRDTLKGILDDKNLVEKIIGGGADVLGWIFTVGGIFSNKKQNKEYARQVKEKMDTLVECAQEAGRKEQKMIDEKKKVDDVEEDIEEEEKKREEKKKEIEGLEEDLKNEKEKLKKKKKELEECLEKQATCTSGPSLSPSPNTTPPTLPPSSPTSPPPSPTSPTPPTPPPNPATPSPSPPPTGNGNGDPHFTTFSGVSFDYHGECDLVMVSSPGFASGSGLAVHVRTTRVNGPLLSYSYIFGAAVGIGKDVMEVQVDGSLVLNGRRYVGKDTMNNDASSTANTNKDDAAVTIPDTFASYPLVKNLIGKKKRIVQYVLSLADDDDDDDHGDDNTNKNPPITITIHANTRTHMLFVKIDADVRDGVGLLGEPRAGDRLVGRDGVTDMSHDWNAYGEEWQVRDFEPKLFQEHDRPPQYPSGCVYEEQSHQKQQQQQKANLRRRLLGGAGAAEVHAATGAIVTIEDATDACADYVGVKKEHCVHDVVAMGDLEVADDPAYA